MKKFLIFSASTVCIALLIVGILKYKDHLSIPAIFNRNNKQIQEIKTKQETDIDIVLDESLERYVVKKDKTVVADFENPGEALDYALTVKRSFVVDQQEEIWIYSSLEPFMIFTDKIIHDFTTLHEAVTYAKRNEHHKIYYKNNSMVIWESSLPAQTNVLEVPLIRQFPELERGCEVTSLAMIFKYYGKDISKMQLAEEIKKDETAYSTGENGRVYYGNPYDGFVGDMYRLKRNGYGVYHGPIYDLAYTYFGEQALDLTGLDFIDVLWFVSNGNPVWFVSNSTYAPLNEESFELWHTPTGIVKITKRMHAAVITGYDEKYVYINDPLKSSTHLKYEKEAFRQAWEQMGNQAVAIFR